MNFMILYFYRRISPTLNNEEREIFLSAVLDKTISASSEVIEITVSFLSIIVHN